MPPHSNSFSAVAFIAGFIPGLVLGGFLVVVLIWALGRRQGLQAKRTSTPVPPKLLDDTIDYSAGGRSIYLRQLPLRGWDEPRETRPRLPTPSRRETTFGQLIDQARLAPCRHSAGPGSV
ncbi:hypothetical protein K470DRAFT_141399 [Piedraia hortae CBS 480.64]|uniref:Uncharacterized protein n=1 Tax=Piedraia hortae CBS 480.64 TaxID=1314780 RepID=A0A6A7C987_9PEZI|nr:hypothetical protein K470DRAFT_141399 [Piedraia hortae CBS 480.64]